MPTGLRKTGISVMGDMPWGTHFCHFHEAKQDLLDTLIPYFKAGLEDNEFCLWVISKLLTEEGAWSALRQAVPDLDRYLAERSIEILPHDEWYLKGGAFDFHRVINGWHEKLDQALARGYAGMRAIGCTAWLQKKDWRDFREYETELNESIANHRMILLCAYPLAASGAAEVLDVARVHQLAVARRKGNWEVVGTPELKQAKAEIKRLNEELEQRVIERTRELAAINEELRREISERQRLEEALRATSEHLRALSASLRSAREEEGARIARELHDELGSALTSLKWDLEDIGKLYLEAGNQTGSSTLREKIEGMMGLIDAAINTVRRISSELRPGILNDLGLVAAIEWQAQQFEARTGIICQFDSFVDTTDLSREHATAIFRIFQEALTNIRRHAQATRVNIMIEEEEGEFVLEVRDNGRGIAEDERTGSQSLGLMGMRERAQLVGGRIEITGVAGKGTVLTVRVLIPSQASDSSTLIGQRGSY
jgi:signal transduction histidine kinase